MNKKTIPWNPANQTPLEIVAGLKDIQLPPNIKTIELPRSAIGSDYSTAGPQGISKMNVNGMACGIEMYLGREALSDGVGGLRPVRWTGWNPKMQRYQGAIECKDLVEERFLAVLPRCASPADFFCRKSVGKKVPNLFFVRVGEASKHLHPKNS